MPHILLASAFYRLLTPVSYKLLASVSYKILASVPYKLLATLGLRAMHAGYECMGALLDPRSHPIDEISKQQHVFNHPLLFLPHDPLELAGEHLILVLIDLPEERFHGGHVGAFALDTFVGSAEELTV